ncbi:YdeI family protein [Olivibacter sp. XZL3]|uniref:YdeI/OmpD-associated family protein n=1 Tax=Olivibacter sp. XZL3 TaxID=1735116 RepID=UPI001066846E|nr:DUF1801 domain-containing protein [Olivibacter sp. XZL3]
MEVFKTADAFYQAQQRWREELKLLRDLIMSTGLKEEVKWGGPVYTYQGKNLVGLAGFKSYFGIWFYQGVFLKDKYKLLINAQDGATKALRQMRFTNVDQADLNIIRAYILEAIDNQEKGLEMKADRSKPIIIPKELMDVLESDATLKARFTRLNKTQQREFTEYIATAKQEKTKQSRLEKIIPLISDGIGLNDKYR